MKRSSKRKASTMDSGDYQEPGDIPELLGSTGDQRRPEDRTPPHGGIQWPHEDS